jgi:hypothetical protein
MSLDAWAHKWGVPPQALVELGAVLTAEAPKLAPPRAVPRSEADIVALARVNASRAGMRLWRNNNGATYDAEGRFIRYGLANESKKLNDVLKSPDLIGWRSVDINITHLGRRMAQFVGIECKAPGWRYTGNGREVAQQKFLTLIEQAGGHARFSCDGGVE